MKFRKMTKFRFNIDKNYVEILDSDKYKKISDKIIMDICKEENITPNDFIEKIKEENSYSKETEKQAEKKRKEIETKLRNEEFNKLVANEDFLKEVLDMVTSMNVSKYFNILCSQIAKKYTDIELTNSELKFIECKINIINNQNKHAELAKRDDWEIELIADKNGNPLHKINNYLAYLEHKSKYTGKIKYNEMFDCIEYDNNIIQDYERDYIHADVETYFMEGRLLGAFVDSALNMYAHNNSYNPVKNYLNSLVNKWDGEKRLETFIIKCLDADDNAINRFFSKTWMIGAVKRAFEPECQFDAVLALQGGVQGSGKTNLIKCLFGSDSPLGFNCYQIFAHGEFSNKDSVDKMNKSWCVLLDEFDKFNDKEVAELKSKITETKMSCRKSYAHNTQEYKVHWVYAATTNADDFLCDLTGDEFERRYWIIECHKTTVDGRVREILTHEYVNQLWAEALHYYLNNEYDELYLSSKNPLFDEYKKYQMKFKRTAKRTEQDYLYEILNKKYVTDEKGYIENSIVFYNRFVQDNIDYTAHYINKIPVSYVRHILNKVYMKDCKPAVIKSMLKQLGGEWEVKQAVYLGKSQSNICVRVVPINEQEENNNISGGLPF